MAKAGRKLPPLTIREKAVPLSTDLLLAMARTSFLLEQADIAKLAALQPIEGRLTLDRLETFAYAIRYDAQSDLDECGKHIAFLNQILTRAAAYLEKLRSEAIARDGSADPLAANMASFIETLRAAATAEMVAKPISADNGATVQTKGDQATSGPNELVAELERQIAELRLVCGEAYQLAGAYDAPVEALDNLSAAANGKPLPHETFLPIKGPEPLRMIIPGAMVYGNDNAQSYVAGFNACRNDVLQLNLGTALDDGPECPSVWSFDPTGARKTLTMKFRDGTFVSYQRHNPDGPGASASVRQPIADDIETIVLASVKELISVASRVATYMPGKACEGFADEIRKAALRIREALVTPSGTNGAS
jgi:hypothetical protein